MRPDVHPSVGRDPQGRPDLEHDFGAPSPRPRRRLAVSLRPLSELPCFGRRRELAPLLQALKEAENGQGATWIISGPAGMGKSHLARQVARWARERGFEVRWGYGIEGAVTPLLPLRLAMRSPDPSASREAASRGPPGRSYRSTWRGSSDTQLLEILHELEVSSRTRSQLVILDDLELADAETLRGIRLLSAFARQLRIMVLGVVRIEGDEWESSRIGSGLLRLRRDGDVKWCDLGPLSGDAPFQLVAHLLGREIDEVRRLEGISQIVQLGGGNPYFLVEMAAAWARERPTTSNGGFAPFALPRPDTPLVLQGVKVPGPVQAVVVERLARLPSSDRLLLSVAAQLGLEFSVSPLAGALRQPYSRTRSRLQRMSSTEWPIIQLQEPDRFAFAHQLVRAVIRHSDGFRPPKPVLQNLTKWWSVHRSEDPATEARFRYALGDKAGALECLRRAVNSLLERSAYPVLADILSGEEPGGIGTEDVSRGRIELLLSAATRLRLKLESYWTGVLLERIPLDALAGYERFLVQSWLVESVVFRDIDAALRRLERLEADAETFAGSERTQALAMVQYMRALCSIHTTPDPDQLHRQLTLGRKMLDDGHHSFERARLLYLDIMFRANEGKWSTAHRLLRSVQSLFAHAGPELRALRLLVVSAESDLNYREGKVDRAVQIHRRLVREYHRRGEVGFEARALLNLGMYELGIRATRSARDHFSQAEAIFGALDVPGALAASQNLGGWACVVDRDWVAAEERFRRATRLSTGSDIGANRWAAAVGLALITAERGEPGRALQELPPLLEAVGQSANYPVEYSCTRARILELLGNVQEARTLWVKALEEVKAPLTDRVELYAHLARWERLYGTPQGVKRWVRRFKGTLGRVSGRPAGPWRGFGLEGKAAPGPRSITRPSPAAISRDEKATSMRDRLLVILNRSGSTAATGVASDPSYGLNEAQIARRIGAPRERLSRALRRLIEQGHVERSSMKPSDGTRRAFYYRLTREGIIVAARVGNVGGLRKLERRG